MRKKKRHADDTSGLTWGGQSYENPDGRVSGNLKTMTVNVTSGVVISASEAVLVSFSEYDDVPSLALPG